ncbi:hypothetical protein KSC_046080 [Ktedonobacter sp. SOSP1-52]|uniref:hypothetical protein n=1 Tax=Ktedonobacter sp. SOSP1-52 TaxID=2778366 RepID=UPI001916800C|nr:hypothetical protein [Ktedonobacter sp. SOSP1-52]GHO65716.1 hypothetical protein KSC_046080 [Ktedonobacter sp. SOSP1-52]
MTEQEARKLKAQIEAEDKRIKVRVMGCGLGFRLKLVLHSGTPNQRALGVGNRNDVYLVKQLWQGL